MDDWPVIGEPLLLERLGLDDEAFHAYLLRFTAALGRRAYEPSHYATASSYPWKRPAGSFVLRDGDAGPWDPARAHDADRIPVLAYGANAAPARLALKLAHLDDPADREVPVLAGRLEGLDVGASSTPMGYGAVVATLVPSPGTRVAVSVLHLRPRQLVQLTWSEVGYAFGRLDGVRFAGEDGTEHRRLLAYVSRLGALCLDGEPVVLGAVPAEGRRFRELSGVELLDTVARIVDGPDGRGEDVVRAIFEDAEAAFARFRPLLRRHARPFEHPGWTRYPVPAAPG